MKFSKIVKRLLGEETVATTVDVGGQEESGGFCEHNPAINKFAFENPVHMFIVFAFVLFTMQKPWGSVVNTFMDFMTWWFTDAAKKLYDNPSAEISYGRDMSFASQPNHAFGQGSKNLIEFWNNRAKIFDDLTALKQGRGSLDKDAKVIITNLASTFEHDDKTPEEKKVHDKILVSLEDTLQSPEYLVFRYLCGLSGLGAPKAGFVTQLIMGKMGCVDSVNTRVYKSFFPSATWDDSGTARSISREKTGKSVGKFAPAKENTMAGYVYFLKYLEHMYSNSENIVDVSRMMWDDWCEIIAQKMIFSTTRGNLENQLIFVKHKTGEGAKMKPYERSARTDKDIDKWMKGGPTTGHRISREHETSLTDTRDMATQARSQFPESTQFMNDEEQLFEMYKKMYSEETKVPKKVDPKKSSKEEPIKQKGEYLEITVPDKV